MSILSISHNDLDGLSCQFVLEAKFKSIDRLNISYNKTLETLQSEKKNFHNYTDIYLTDLVIDNEIRLYLEFLADTYPKINFFVTDHHYSSEKNLKNLDKPNIKAIYSETSSTKCLADYFELSSEYVEAVNAFDLWETASSHFEKGMIYNTLFWDYKLRYFYSQFKRSKKLKENHITDYERTLRKRDVYFKDLEEKKLVLKDENVLLMFGDEHQNWTQLVYEGYKFYVQVFSFGKISVKISRMFGEDECLVIINDIKEAINSELLLNIGGHHHVLSLTHTGNKDYEVIIDYTKKILGVLQRKC